MKPKSVIVSDTTLRDGHQQPGLAFTLDERLYIASMLQDIGVDVIEAGFPANAYDAEPVLRIAQEIRGPKISALARVVKSDIDAAYESLKPAADRGDGMVHAFIGTSEMHQTHSHRKNAEQVTEMVDNMVRYAVKLFGDVQFSPEDATRTDRDYLDLIISTAIAAGAHRINIPDTVGYTYPSEFTGLIRHIIDKHPTIKSRETILSVHCHNDLESAVANTVEAIGAGAAQFEGTINGLGERAGNTNLATVIIGLRKREDLWQKLGAQNYDASHIDTTQFKRVADAVDVIAEMPTYANRPVTGTNAFRDSSGIHATAVLRNPGTYHIMRAEDVGSKVEIVVGPTSGTNMIQGILDKFGYEATDEKVQETTEALKGESIKYKDAFTESEAHVYIRRALGLSPQEDPIKLGPYDVITGASEVSTPPNAAVTLYVNGEKRVGFEAGVGPIDAVAKAILQALNGSATEEIKLIKFDEMSVSAGTEAIARAQVALEYKGDVYWGRNRAPDIVKAGVNALMEAINSIYILNPSIHSKPAGE
jgi:2-isopropylmalate synthase|tara:strand:- start:789 stop:2390 length:1602 start_codon:yes stop_codon:yes gene_type:complete